MPIVESIRCWKWTVNSSSKKDLIGKIIPSKSQLEKVPKYFPCSFNLIWMNIGLNS